MDFDIFVTSLLDDNESCDLEYKSAAGGFPGSFWDTYSSFANTQGGTIVLGVKERWGQFTFDGLADDNIRKYIKEFWSCVNNKNHVSANIMKEDDVEVAEYGGNKIILFNVPRATRTQRPVYRTTNPYNGTFKRNDEGDYKCTEQEVRRMFADADDSSPRDCRILKGFTMADIDRDSLRQYRNIFASVSPVHPWLALDDIDLLRKLGGYRTDRITGEEGLTLAAMLMFGKYDSITDNGCAPNFFLDYRNVPADNSVERWADRIYPDGTWEANLFQFYWRVLPKLTAALPKPFKMESSLRIDDTPSHVAVREALVNALVHSDYSEDGGVVIEQRKNMITFSNPGNMLISISQYYGGGESVCRNKSLQKMFMLIGTAEKAGSGVDKILAGWKEENWKKPYVTEKQRPDRVILLLPMESLLPAQNVRELARMFGEKAVHMNYNKLSTLSTCYTEGMVTNARLKDLLPLHSADITKMLRELSLDGFLVSYGTGRGTKYRINQKVDTSDDEKVESLGQKVESSDVKVDTSDDEKVESSGQKVESSGQKVESSDEETNITDNTRLQPRSKKLELLIIESAQEFITVEEIANKVGRRAWYLRNKVLPRMIAEGKMERLYQSSTHPNQKYKAKQIKTT